MPKIETYRKRAKQIVRWHREGNYSVGGKVRQIARYRDLKDADVLAMPLPLALAQEVVAVEAGFADWAALKASLDGVPAEPRRAEQAAAAGARHPDPVRARRGQGGGILMSTSSASPAIPPRQPAVLRRRRRAMRRAFTSGWCGTELR